MKANECLFCSDEKTKTAKVVPYPDTKRESSYPIHYSVVGGWCSNFRKATKYKKAAYLMGEAFHVMNHQGIPFKQVFAALMEIDECREVIEKDFL